MKTNSFKKLLLVGMLTAGLTGAHQASADIYFGPSIFLNTADSATDVYALNCPIGTVRVQAQVGNKLNGVAEFISMQVISPNGRGQSTNSREFNPSPILDISGSAGVYLVTVHKSEGNAVEPYDANMDCFTRDSITGKLVEVPGTQSTLVQNQ
jgi:hypothetical protein